MKITTTATLTHEQLRNLVWSHMIESLTQDELGDTGEETLRFDLDDEGRTVAIVELSREAKS
jgi:hypothetical protein